MKKGIKPVLLEGSVEAKSSSYAKLTVGSKYPFPDNLKEALEQSNPNRGLVVFIGAGFSRLFGMPGWDDYAKLKLAYLREKNYIDHETLHRFADIPDKKVLLTIIDNILEKEAERLRDKSILTEFEKELFDFNRIQGKNRKKIEQYNDVISKLSTYQALFITTNYDNFLELEGNLDRIKDYSVIDRTNPDSWNKKVVHIHGYFDDSRDRLLITSLDYMRQYYNPSLTSAQALNDFLKFFFKDKIVLFIGAGMTEYELLSFLFHDSKDLELKHTFLYPCFKHEKITHFEEYYKNYGINLYRYDLNENGYEELLEVLRQWSPELSIDTKIAAEKDILQRISLNK